MNPFQSETLPVQKLAGPEPHPRQQGGRSLGGKLQKDFIGCVLESRELHRQEQLGYAQEGSQIRGEIQLHQQDHPGCWTSPSGRHIWNWSNLGGAGQVPGQRPLSAQCPVGSLPEDDVCINQCWSSGNGRPGRGNWRWWKKQNMDLRS